MMISSALIYDAKTKPLAKKSLIFLTIFFPLIIVYTPMSLGCRQEQLLAVHKIILSSPIIAMAINYTDEA